MFDNPTPMLAPHSAAPIDMATDYAIPILARLGAQAVTPRTIGEQCGVSRQAVHQWFGSQELLRRAVAQRFVARWCRWMSLRVHGLGSSELLPRDEAELEWTSALLALIELGRTDEPIGLTMGAWHEAEVSVIERPNARLAHACVMGLRGAVCRRVDPLAVDEAHALFEECLTALA